MNALMAARLAQLHADLAAVYADLARQPVAVVEPERALTLPEAAAAIVVHWRSVYEPHAVDESSDLLPIDGTFRSHEHDEGGEAG
jgi:hypothetical protein